MDHFGKNELLGIQSGFYSVANFRANLVALKVILFNANCLQSSSVL